MNKLFDNLKKNIPVTIRANKNPLQAIQNQFDKAVSDFYSILESPRFSMMSFEDLSLSPSVDIIEDDKNFKVECEMPGMGEEDIHVAVQDGMLAIKGEKETSRQDKDKNYLLREIGYGSYERNILLPENIDIDKASASFKKGMLWVNIPKKAGVKLEARELKVEKIEGASKEDTKGTQKGKVINVEKDEKRK